jgi:hypothetical protein
MTFTPEIATTLGYILAALVIIAITLAVLLAKKIG